MSPPLQAEAPGNRYLQSGQRWGLRAQSCCLTPHHPEALAAVFPARAPRVEKDWLKVPEVQEAPLCRKAGLPGEAQATNAAASCLVADGV